MPPIEDKIDELITALDNVANGLAAVVKASGKTATAPKNDSSGKPKGNKLPSLDDMKTKLTNYLNEGPGGAKQKGHRNANLKAIAYHFGVERVTQVPQKDYPDVLDKLQKFIDGEDPFEGDGGEEDEGAVV